MPHYKELSNSINLSLAACQNKLILAGDLPQDYNFAGVISRTLTIYPPIGEPYGWEVRQDMADNSFYKFAATASD
jgi:hypothetical protein